LRWIYRRRPGREGQKSRGNHAENVTHVSCPIDEWRSNYKLGQKEKS
jgi:hypothetical protein